MNKKIFIGNRKPSGGETGRDIAHIEEQAVVLPRRAVLRGALAVGCGLLVPAALLGCEAGNKPETDSSESDNAASAADPATAALPEPAPGAESGAPAAPEKASQESVQYQTQPKGEQKCANCTHFVAESNTCQRVEGDISPEGWCTLWAKGGLSGRYQQGRKPMTMLA